MAALALGGCDASKDAAGATAMLPAEQVQESGPAVGSVAPDVVLNLHDGKQVRLGELRGKQVVLYFYPRDDTPGCRIEAQGFRDQMPSLEKSGALVFGVSTQGAESHQAFIDKEQLNFDLVVDEDGALAKAFGVPVRAKLAARHTVLIDADGKIKKYWRSVNPSGHAEEVLAEL